MSNIRKRELVVPLSIAPTKDFFFASPDFTFVRYVNVDITEACRTIFNVHRYVQNVDQWKINKSCAYVGVEREDRGQEVITTST